MKQLGLLQKLIIILIVVIIVPFCVGGYFTYSLNYDSLLQEMTALNQGLFARGTQSLENYLDGILMLPLSVYIDDSPEVLKNLRTQEPWVSLQEKELRDYLKVLAASKDAVLGIELAGNNGSSITVVNSVSGNRWRSYVRAAGLEPVDGMQVVTGGDGACIGVYRKSLVDYPRYDLLGVMTVYFDLNEIRSHLDYLTSPQEQASFMVLYEKKDILYASLGGAAAEKGEVDLDAPADGRSFSKGRLGGMDGFYFYREFVKQGYAFTVLKFVPERRIVASALSVVGKVFAVEAVLFVFVLLFFLYIYRSVVKPVRRISGNMDKVQDGIYAYKAESDSNDELGRLDHKYEEMITQLNVLINKDMRSALEITRARLKMLQAQINPHFLNNMLQFISTAALEQGAFDVSENLACLGRIFQYNMNIEGAQVCFEEECRHIENYLTLQAGMHENRLEYTLDVAQEALAVRVPKMILQPLVENSIKYNGWEDMCRIRIAAAVADGYLKIQVMDNGPGFTDDKIRKIQADFLTYQAKSTREHGIGLLNVLLRLKIYTDGRFLWSIKNDVYTTVSLEIPVLLEEDLIEGTGC